MAAITPRPARVCPSLRASQQAKASDNIAAPVTRAITSAPGASSDAPISSEIAGAGEDSIAMPVAASSTAVSVSRYFAMLTTTLLRAICIT